MVIVSTQVVCGMYVCNLLHQEYLKNGTCQELMENGNQFCTFTVKDMNPGHPNTSFQRFV